MPQHELVVDPGLCVGFDVGGTKINVLSSDDDTVHRYSTADFPSMEDVLDAHFHKLGRLPVSVALAMAGPRDDETGAVRLTNGNWPAFEPLVAEEGYCGTTFRTVNDMVGTAAGVLVEHGVDLTALKPGTPAEQGTKLVLAVSTGFGGAAAVWDQRSGRHVFMASEGGHAGIHPQNEDEAAYLQWLQGRYPRISAELALAGKFGIGSLADFVLEHTEAPVLAASLQHARDADRPVGAVLLGFAAEGEGQDQVAAQKILHLLGGMLGSAMRDFALTVKATGGVYLTGSVMLALGEYLAANTDFLERFVHPGAVHAGLLEKVPIYLVDDPNVAVKGALQLAKDNS